MLPLLLIVAELISISGYGLVLYLEYKKRISPKRGQILRSTFLVTGMTCFLLRSRLDAEPPVSNVASIQQLIQQIDEGKLTQIEIAPVGEDLYSVKPTPKSGHEKSTSSREDTSTAYYVPQPLMERVIHAADKQGLILVGPQNAPASTSLTSRFFSSLVSLIPMLLLGLVLLYSASGVLNIGGMRFKPEKSSVTFKDVAGIGNAKATLAWIVDYLKDPEKHSRLGGKIPRGALLKGAPGTGKTLLARAVAGEANVSFFYISGSSFAEMYVGMAAKRVRELFKAAKKYGPSIIFIDEIETIGKRRTGAEGGAQEMEGGLNELLTAMDGFSPADGIFVIAATNRPEMLDAALLRPGRLELQIEVERPDEAERLATLEVITKRDGFILSDDLRANLQLVAHATIGFTGAELFGLLNGAARLATEANKPAIDLRDVENQLDRMLVGEPGAVIVFDKLRHATALHEAGHAVAAYTVGSFFKASIRPAGHSLGRVIRIPANEGRWITRESLISEMVIILAGRVAEEVEHDKDDSFQVGAGAADDLQKATIMARRMVTEWGFGSKIGSKVLHEPGGPQPTAQEGSMFPVSSQTLQNMDDDIAEIMSDAHQKSRELLSAYEPLFRAIARELEKRHDLSLLDVRELPEAELEAKPTSAKTT